MALPHTKEEALAILVANYPQFTFSACSDEIPGGKLEMFGHGRGMIVSGNRSYFMVKIGNQTDEVTGKVFGMCNVVEPYNNMVNFVCFPADKSVPDVGSVCASLIAQ